MNQQDFSSIIRYRGPNVTARQVLFEQINADLESAFAAYLAQPPVDLDDAAYTAANDLAYVELCKITSRFQSDALLICDDDRTLIRALIVLGGVEAGHRAESIVRAEWRSEEDYAAALIEVRTWANLAILADLWPTA